MTPGDRAGHRDPRGPEACHGDDESRSVVRSLSLWPCCGLAVSRAAAPGPERAIGVQLAIERTDDRIEQAEVARRAAPTTSGAQDELELADRASRPSARPRSSRGAAAASRCDLTLGARVARRSARSRSSGAAGSRSRAGPARAHARADRSRARAHRGVQRSTARARCCARRSRCRCAPRPRPATGAYLAALQLTMSARERALRALRLCNVEENLQRQRGARAAAHRRGDRARPRRGRGRDREPARAGARARGRAAGPGLGEFRAEHFEASLRLTQSARAFAHRALRLARHAARSARVRRLAGARRRRSSGPARPWPRDRRGLASRRLRAPDARSRGLARAAGCPGSRARAPVAARRVLGVRARPPTAAPGHAWGSASRSAPAADFTNELFYEDAFVDTTFTRPPPAWARPRRATRACCSPTLDGHARSGARPSIARQRAELGDKLQRDVARRRAGGDDLARTGGCSVAPRARVPPRPNLRPRPRGVAGAAVGARARRRWLDGASRAPSSAPAARLPAHAPGRARSSCSTGSAGRVVDRRWTARRAGRRRVAARLSLRRCASFPDSTVRDHLEHGWRARAGGTCSTAGHARRDRRRRLERRATRADAPTAATTSGRRRRARGRAGGVGDLVVARSRRRPRRMHYDLEDDIASTSTTRSCAPDGPPVRARARGPSARAPRVELLLAPSQSRRGVSRDRRRRSSSSASRAGAGGA